MLNVKGACDEATNLRCEHFEKRKGALGKNAAKIRHGKVFKDQVEQLMKF